MSDKTASIRLTLGAQGFISGVRALERQVKSSGASMTQQLSGVGRAAASSLDASTRSAKRLQQTLSAASSGTLLQGMKTLETTSRTTFQRISSDARQAFGGMLGRIGEVKAAIAGLGGRRGLISPETSIFAKHGYAGGGGSESGGITAFGLSAGMAAFNLAGKAIGAAAHEIGAMAKEANATHEAAAQLSVNAHQGGAYVDPKQLENEFYAVTQAVKGTTSEQAAEAASKFVAMTGDLDTARASLLTFATVSKATGANMSDVAEATASISRQFKITDPEEIKDTLGALVAQGKRGSVMLPELAMGLQRIAAAGAAFGLHGSEGVKTLGGLTQIARGGTGSADQAFTAVERIMANLIGHAKELQGQHVAVYEGHGAERHTRDVADILIDTIAKTGGKNVARKNELLQSIFGEEGIRGVKPLITAYQNAYAGATGKGGGPASDAERREAGIAALKKMFDDATNAGGSWTDVVRDSAKMQETNSAQITAAYERMTAQVATSVLPQLSKFVDALAKSPEAINAFTQAIILSGEFLAKILRAFGIGVDDRVSAKDIKEGAKRDQKRAKVMAELDSDENKKRAAELFGHKHVPQGTGAVDPLAAMQNADEQQDKFAAVLDPLHRRTAAESKFTVPAPALPPGVAMQLPKGGVPGTAPTGPIKIDGIQSTVKVEIVADRTARGGGSGGPIRIPPLPGYTPRP